jgi:hypothetical protein
MLNKESINNIEYNFNGFKKNIKQIPKYIAQNKIDEKLKEKTKVKFIKNIDNYFYLIYIINIKKYTIVEISMFNKQRI